MNIGQVTGSSPVSPTVKNLCYNISIMQKKLSNNYWYSDSLNGEVVAVMQKKA